MFITIKGRRINLNHVESYYPIKSRERNFEIYINFNSGKNEILTLKTKEECDNELKRIDEVIEKAGLQAYSEL